MKNFLITVVAVLGVLGVVALSSYSLEASSSVDCPNGCLANGNGCVCNGYWECLLEANGDVSREYTDCSILIMKLSLLCI